MPGIVEKLQPPAARAPLTRQTVWWKEALPLLGDRARCIYTGAPLDPDDLSLDHYLPWSFVAHDRPWNLVPVSPRVNSAKSDSLPDRRYLAGLAGIQHAAPLAEQPASKWDDILAINLSAAFHTMQQALPGMAERGYGRVLNIASVHGLVASKNKAP